MDNEQRKAEIRRRLNLAKYPKRSAAKFTDEDDHNPLIWADCPRCSGHGHVCYHSMQSDEDGFTATITTDDCPVCNGSGIAEELVRYFDNESPAMNAKANSEGWVKCPCCGWRFALKDKEVWTGRRHKRCGQKLNIE